MFLTNLNLGIAVRVQVEEEQTTLKAVVALDGEVAMQLEDKCPLFTTRSVFKYISLEKHRWITIGKRK